MPIVTGEGVLRLPVVYATWADWREGRSDTIVVEAPVAASCAMCWGQGRILEHALNGEGRIPVACAVCAGTGRAPG